MKAGFVPGIWHEVEVVVTEDMCPAFDGVVVHRVYSTWSMVHHMEVACRKVLVGYLEPDEEGIGAHITVDHISPAVLGSNVTVRAELLEVRHNRAICRVTAWQGSRQIGEGRQTQAILKRHRLDAILTAAARPS